MVTSQEPAVSTSEIDESELEEIEGKKQPEKSLTSIDESEKEEERATVSKETVQDKKSSVSKEKKQVKKKVKDHEPEESVAPDEEPMEISQQDESIKKDNSALSFQMRSGICICKTGFFRPSVASEMLSNACAGA